MVIECVWGDAAPQVEKPPATVTIGHDDGCDIRNPVVVENFSPEKALRQICTRRLNKRRNLHPTSDQITPSIDRGQVLELDEGRQLTERRNIRVRVRTDSGHRISEQPHVCVKANRTMQFAENLSAKRSGIGWRPAEGLDPLPNAGACRLCDHGLDSTPDKTRLARRDRSRAQLERSQRAGMVTVRDDAYAPSTPSRESRDHGYSSD